MARPDGKSSPPVFHFDRHTESRTNDWTIGRLIAAAQEMVGHEKVLAGDFQDEVSIDYASSGVVRVVASPITSVAVIQMASDETRGDA